MKKTNLAEKFIKLTKDQDLYPQLFNVAIFTPPLSAFLRSEHYSDKSKTAYLVAMKQGQPTTAFVSEFTVKNTAVEVFTKYWQTPKFLKENTKKVEYFNERLDKLYSLYTQSYIQKTSLNNLPKIAEKVLSVNQYLNTYIWFTIFDFDKDFLVHLINQLRINLSPDRLTEIWEPATTPAFDSFEKRRQLIIWHLILKGVLWKEIAQKCQYFFANYDQVKDLASVEHKLIKEYGGLSSREIKKLIKQSEAESEKKMTASRRWFSTLSPTEKKVVRFLQEIIRIRDIRKDGVSKALAIMYQIANRYLSELDLQASLIPYLSSYELKLGLDYLKSNRSDIQLRPKGTIMLWSMTNSFPIQFEYGTYGETVRQLGKYYLSKQTRKQNKGEIKGQVASKGKVVGVVRIVTNPSKDNGFKEGDILVTGMTRPEFVPLMKKAGAIVTNEGGITSHAAIVSRELNIPCIVGTRVATAVLKNGDMVEVDATIGIVKILRV